MGFGFVTPVAPQQAAYVISYSLLVGVISEGLHEAEQKVGDKARELRSLFVTKSEPRHPPLVKTSGLGKRYGSIAAVRDLNISVRRGEVYDFLGPHGAGETKP